MTQPTTDSQESLTQRAFDYVWGPDLSTAPPLTALYFHTIRFLFVVGRDLAEGQLTLRAMSLVYTTLLSLVPLLAISFSVLKGFGVHNQIEPMLLNLVAPLGDKGTEIVAQIIEFVERMKVGVLGSVGVALLIYTAVAVMQKIERALNYIWHISRPRPLAQRFSDYLSVILVGPLLIFASLGISASLTSATLFEDVLHIAPIGTAVKFLGTLIPFVLSVGAFAFIYMFIPNTRVRFVSALVGAVVAAVLWKTVGWAFASFVVSSGRYAAVYSAFATLIFFMIWLYLSWLILMIGAAVAFYHQHPEHVKQRREAQHLSNRVKERLALLIMQYIGARFYEDGGQPTADDIATATNAPMDAVERVLTGLEDAGLLTCSGDDRVRYLPARPLDTLLVGDVVDAIRKAGEDGYLTPERLRHVPGIDTLSDETDEARARAFNGRTVKDLAVNEGKNPVAAPGE